MLQESTANYTRDTQQDHVLPGFLKGSCDLMGSNEVHVLLGLCDILVSELTWVGFVMSPSAVGFFCVALLYILYKTFINLCF